MSISLLELRSRQDCKIKWPYGLSREGPVAYLGDICDFS